MPPSRVPAFMALINKCSGPITIIESQPLSPQTQAIFKFSEAMCNVYIHNSLPFSLTISWRRACGLGFPCLLKQYKINIIILWNSQKTFPKVIFSPRQPSKTGRERKMKRSCLKNNVFLSLWRLPVHFRSYLAADYWFNHFKIHTLIFPWCPAKASWPPSTETPAQVCELLTQTHSASWWWLCLPVHPNDSIGLWGFATPSNHCEFEQVFWPFS